MAAQSPDLCCFTASLSLLGLDAFKGPSTSPVASALLIELLLQALRWGQQHACCMQEFPTVEPGSAGYVGVQIMPENYNLLTTDGPPFPMDPVDEELTTVTCGTSAQVLAWGCGEEGGGWLWALRCQLWCTLPVSYGWWKCKLLHCPSGVWSLLGLMLEGGLSNGVVRLRNALWGLPSQQAASAPQQAERRMQVQHHKRTHGNLQVSHTWDMLLTKMQVMQGTGIVRFGGPLHLGSPPRCRL